MINENSKEMLIKKITSDLLYSKNNNFIDTVRNLIVNDKYFSAQEFLNLIIYPETLKFLNESDLFVIYNAMAKISPKSYNIEDFFTEVEIIQNKSYRRNNKDSIKKLLTLNDAFLLDKNQWTCRLSVAQLAKMKGKNLIRVDYKYQRQSKEIYRNVETDEILRQIHVNWDRVSEISQKIANGTYSYNTVRLNMMDYNDLQPYYDSENHFIRIPKDADVIIPDGNHRIMACVKAYNDYPTLRKIFENKYFQVAFTFYPPEQVKECIIQEWDTEKVIAKHKKALENKFSTFIVEYIVNNKNVEPLFAKNIVNTREEYIAGNGFLIYSDLADGIEFYYKVSEYKLKAEAINLADWLIEVFNYLTSLFVDNYLEFKENKTITMPVYYHISKAYICLSYLVKDLPNWKYVLKNFLEYINFGNLTYENIVNDLPQDKILKTRKAINICTYLNDSFADFQKQRGDING